MERCNKGPTSGRKLLRGFSAYMRASKACPMRGISCCWSGSVLPEATCYSSFEVLRIVREGDKDYLPLAAIRRGLGR